MKILLINDYATPTGGAEISTLTLRDELRRLGHDARLFASSARPHRCDSLADYECFGTTSRFRTLLQTANPWAYIELRRVLAAFRPDVVHVGMFLTQLSPLILPLLKDVPSIYQVHWYRPICPLGTKTFPDGSACHVPAGRVCYQKDCLPLHDWLPLMLQMTLWRRWRHAFNVIVANSEAVKQRLIAEGIEPVEVLWPCIPIEAVRPPLSAPPIVAFAGRLVRQKGADVLVRAFAQVVTRVPNARLLIAGDGPEREFLRRLVADLGLSSSVTMLGHLARSDVERYFVTAWVQVVPSLFAESFGLVAVEAMMRGTAVVASASDGLMEIVREAETGFLVPPGDADALAKVLVTILLHRELADRMGNAGRQVALTHFRQESYIKRIVEVYHALSRRESDSGRWRRKPHPSQ